MESTQNEIDFADQNIAINNNMDNLMLKKTCDLKVNPLK